MLIRWLLQRNKLEAESIEGGEAGHGVPDKNTVAGRFLKMEKTVTGLFFFPSVILRTSLNQEFRVRLPAPALFH
jgi:hypothetical protein